MNLDAPVPSAPTNPTNAFADEHDLFALRVRLEGIDRPYYVMTEPRVHLGQVELDLHPAPVDVILREHEAVDRLRHWRWHLSHGAIWNVLLLDNARLPRRFMVVTTLDVVRVRRQFYWTEEVGS